MADARKRKLDEIEKRLDEVEASQEKQWKTHTNLQKNTKEGGQVGQLA